jgi:hypothetical protein
MATKLEVIEDHADIVPAPAPHFDPAPTRKPRPNGTVAKRLMVTFKLPF